MAADGADGPRPPLAARLQTGTLHAARGTLQLHVAQSRWHHSLLSRKQTGTANKPTKRTKAQRNETKRANHTMRRSQLCSDVPTKLKVRSAPPAGPTFPPFSRPLHPGPTLARSLLLPVFACRMSVRFVHCFVSFVVSFCFCSFVRSFVNNRSRWRWRGACARSTRRGWCIATSSCIIFSSIRHATPASPTSAFRSAYASAPLPSVRSARPFARSSVPA